jgi:hypothetical protein
MGLALFAVRVALSRLHKSGGDFLNSLRKMLNEGKPFLRG